jgi:hypothetical protein
VIGIISQYRCGVVIKAFSVSFYKKFPGSKFFSFFPFWYTHTKGKKKKKGKGKKKNKEKYGLLGKW